MILEIFLISPVRAHLCVRTCVCAPYRTHPADNIQVPRNDVVSSTLNSQLIMTDVSSKPLAGFKTTARVRGTVISTLNSQLSTKITLN
jgi:hypothetical protein